jgi:hypothetical protein
MHIGQINQLDEIAHLVEVEASQAEMAPGNLILIMKARVPAGGHADTRTSAAESTTFVLSVSVTLVRRERAVSQTEGVLLDRGP